MFQPEKPRIILSESEVTGRFILGNNQKSDIDVVPTRLDDGGVRYEVTGRLSLERQAIASIMGAPFGIESPDWKDVYEDLRDISHQNRSVRGLARTSLQLVHLKEIGQASGELAQALADNQNERTETLNLPIFDTMAADAHVRDEMQSMRFEAYLRNLTLDPRLKAKIQKVLAMVEVNPLDAASRELEASLGFTDSEIQAIINKFLVDELGPDIETELFYRIKNDIFVGSRSLTTYDSHGFHGGGSDVEQYIRRDTLPVRIQDRMDETRLVIGAPLPNTNNNIGSHRARVVFSTRASKVVVHPQLAWETRGNRRDFVFPSNPYTAHINPHHDDRLGRANSIVGAVLAAGSTGRERDIDYASEYIKRRSDKWKFRSNQPLPVAGLSPAVLDYRAADITENEYFTLVEAATRKRM